MPYFLTIRSLMFFFRLALGVSLPKHTNFSYFGKRIWRSLVFTWPLVHDAKTKYVKIRKTNFLFICYLLFLVSWIPIYDDVIV